MNPAQNRLNVEGRVTEAAESLLQLGRRAGEYMVRGGGGQYDEVDRLRRHVGPFQSST